MTGMNHPKRPPGRPVHHASGKTRGFAFHLPPAHDDTIERATKRLRMTRSEYIRMLIEQTEDWQ